MQSVPYRFAATTVSAGAIALLLLSLQSQRVEAEPSNEPARVEHLEALLVEHDVRYILRASGNSPSDCVHSDAERG